MTLLLKKWYCLQYNFEICIWSVKLFPRTLHPSTPYRGHPGVEIHSYPVVSRDNYLGQDNLTWQEHKIYPFPSLHLSCMCSLLLKFKYTQATFLNFQSILMLHLWVRYAQYIVSYCRIGHNVGISECWHKVSTNLAIKLKKLATK